MPHFDTHFTLREANELIPRMQEIFFQVHSLIHETRNMEELSFDVEKLTSGRVNGHHKKQGRSKKNILDEIDALVTEIVDHGIVIQDVSRGLIDFPAFIQGREVFLCYELADGNQIQYWHDLETGYAGRQPIPSDME